jgi:DNA-binding NarL/FixJ family response regulator
MTFGTMAIRVAVVEDNRDLRESLVRLINGNLSPAVCVGAFPRCEGLIEAVSRIRPEVVVMDVGLPGVSGIEGARKLRQLSPETEVLMLTVHEDEETIFEAIRAGASGYLLKKNIIERLFDAIREIHCGGVPMSSAVARKVLSAFAPRRGKPGATIQLSGREREILSALVNGQSYKMVADGLGISIDTVRTHIKSIYEKLHVHSKSEAVATALKNRLL